jgi:tetratricopeptide (TPR) repeat protein
MVLGRTDARACYEAARDGRSDPGALTICDKAVQQDWISGSDLAATHVNRGILSMRRNDVDVAIADFNRAIRLRPNIGEAYLNRGAALLLKGADQAALNDLTNSLRLGSRQPQSAHYNRAIARERLGDVRGAYDDYQAALALTPDWQLPQTQLKRFKIADPNRPPEVSGAIRAVLGSTTQVLAPRQDVAPAAPGDQPSAGDQPRN